MRSDSYFLPLTTVCLAAAALFFCCVLALFFACFCAACLFVAFGDLSPIGTDSHPEPTNCEGEMRVSLILFSNFGSLSEITPGR